MRKSMMLGIALGLSLLTAASAFAQLAEKKVITLAAARKMVAAAEAEAERNHWAAMMQAWADYLDTLKVGAEVAAK
jgi:glc operon protein GlcG